MNNIISQPIPAVYDNLSGMMQRTLKNGNTVSVLFGTLANPKMGKKGIYMDLPSNLTGVVLPMSVNDGNGTYSGTIKIGEYDYEHGMYNATFKIGRSSITKEIKVHDLATLWCVVSTAVDVLNLEFNRLEKAAARQAKKTA